MSLFLNAYCAAVGANALESANVVGYQSTVTPSLGNKLVAGTFVTVGESGTFTLADLKGAGYDPDDGAWGEMKVTVLNSAGSEAKDGDGNELSFYWYDNEDVAAGWYNGDGDEAWDAANVVFDAGTSFWIAGDGQTITAAGEVKLTTVKVETPSLGNKATGNPFPVQITLANMAGADYDPDDGAWGEMKVTILNSAGSEAKDGDGNELSFYWYDNEDVAAGWYNGDGDEAWDPATVIAAGEGFWVAGDGQSLVFTPPAM